MVCLMGCDRTSRRNRSSRLVSLSSEGMGRRHRWVGVCGTGLAFASVQVRSLPCINTHTNQSFVDLALKSCLSYWRFITRIATTTGIGSVGQHSGLWPLLLLFCWHHCSGRRRTCRWYKEEESGSMSAVVSTQRMHIHDSVLVINQVMAADSGKWLCAANNSVGEEKVGIKLMVISTIVVHIEPDLLVADIGKSATFNCSLAVNPINSHVIWLKDGRPLITDAFNGPINDGRVRLIEPSLLNIRNVIREDAGPYLPIVIRLLIQLPRLQSVQSVECYDQCCSPFESLHMTKLLIYVYDVCQLLVRYWEGNIFQITLDKTNFWISIII